MKNKLITVKIFLVALALACVCLPVQAQSTQQTQTKQATNTKPTADKTPELKIGEWVEFKDDKYEIKVKLISADENNSSFDKILVSKYDLKTKEFFVGPVVDYRISRDDDDSIGLEDPEDEEGWLLGIYKSDSLASAQVVEYVDVAIGSPEGKPLRENKAVKLSFK